MNFDRWIRRTLFIFVCICEFIAGYYVCHIKGFIFTDAISRVANAFYVLYSTPPHLGAIGLVWNPLPSLLELPMLLLWPVYKPLTSSALAAVILTSLFAAGSAVLIYDNGIRFGLSKKMGVSLALLYCSNPFIFIYGFNGMSEVPFFFMVIWFLSQFVQWVEDGEPHHIAEMGGALALAFLIRYEAIPITACATFAVFVIISFEHKGRHKTERHLKDSFTHGEATVLLLLLPVALAFVLWILVNYIIKGNPLYFLNSNYSNLAQAQALEADAVMKGLIGQPVLILRFIFQKSLYFLPVLAGIIFFRIIQRRFFQWDLLILSLFILSTNALQFVMISKGASFGWFRFFAYPFPSLLAWLPYELKKANSKIFLWLCIVMLAVTNIGVGRAWFDSAVAPEEFKDLSFSYKDPREEAQREIARYINAELPEAKILMDSFKTYNVIINVDKPSNLVFTSCFSFEDSLEDPVENGIDYVLIPSTIDYDDYRLDAVNHYYPQLYSDGAEWCRLYKEFGRYYRMYRVEK